jgi:23S rRNA (adenine2503-C2)-methyltransferase
MRGWFSMTAAEQRDWLASHGQPPMRAGQLRRWILVAGAESFEEMTDLPKELRQALNDQFTPLSMVVMHHATAADGTHKLVLRLEDGKSIECVLIQDASRRTACISTQVGCGMACVFCASGIDGVVRNLTTAEILEQLIRLRNVARKEAGPDARLTNIVVMGMGEPLANLETLIEALGVAGSKDGLDVGARHVTISTVGLPIKIRRLADVGKQYHLAVSLHAPNDELRTRIVPTNRQTGLPEILAAADYFFEKTGRRVTFEYVLLRDINDRIEHATELGQLLRGRHALVNLIPFNDVEGLPYRRPTQERLTAFVDELHRSGVSVKVRKRKGSEIDAACGQLRRRVEAGEGMTPKLARKELV